MAKVLTVGEILVEIVATTKGDGFREAQPLIGPFPSGAPAIFIDQVGKLGTPCAILGRVGDDDFGQLNLDRLRRDGVDALPKLHGALLKNEQDVHLFERLAFMARRQR